MLFKNMFCFLFFKISRLIQYNCNERPPVQNTQQRYLIYTNNIIEKIERQSDRLNTILQPTAHTVIVNRTGYILDAITIYLYTYF